MLALEKIWSKNFRVLVSNAQGTHACRICKLPVLMTWGST